MRLYKSPTQLWRGHRMSIKRMFRAIYMCQPRSGISSRISHLAAPECLRIWPPWSPDRCTIGRIPARHSHVACAAAFRIAVGLGVELRTSGDIAPEPRSVVNLHDWWKMPHFGNYAKARSRHDRKRPRKQAELRTRKRNRRTPERKALYVKPKSRRPGNGRRRALPSK